MSTLLSLDEGWPMQGWRLNHRVARTLEGYSDEDVTRALKLMREFLAGRPRKA